MSPRLNRFARDGSDFVDVTNTAQGRQATQPGQLCIIALCRALRARSEVARQRWPTARHFDELWTPVLADDSSQRPAVAYYRSGRSNSSGLTFSARASFRIVDSFGSLAPRSI